MGATLAGGGCFVLQEVFEPGDALRLLAHERVTEPYTLPHQARALFEHPDWETTDLSSLREVYGKSVFTRHPSVEGDKQYVVLASTLVLLTVAMEGACGASCGTISRSATRCALRSGRSGRPA